MAMNERFIIRESHSSLSYRSSWIQLVRPMTFTGTISPVLAGTALAAMKGPVRLDLLAAILLSGLFVQMSMNMLNDYFDYKKGQDHDKWVEKGHPDFGKGPYYQAIPYVAGVLISITVAISVWMASQSTYWVLAVGGIGFILAFLYSGGPRPLCSIGLGEFDAAICMGLIPAILSYVIQGHSLDFEILAITFPFLLFVSSMILSNNLRDLEKDKGIRHTLPMLLGRIRASHLLNILLSLGYLWVIVLVILQLIPFSSSIVVFALPLAFRLYMSYRPSAKRTDEIKGMKRAALHHWCFGLLFAVGLTLSGL